MNLRFYLSKKAIAEKEKANAMTMDLALGLIQKELGKDKYKNDARYAAAKNALNRYSFPLAVTPTNAAFVIELYKDVMKQIPNSKEILKSILKEAVVSSSKNSSEYKP